MYRKGLALEVVGFIIIAVAGILILTAFFGTRMKRASQDLFCKLLLGSRWFLPLPENMRPSIPSYCINTSVPKFESVEVRGTDPGVVATKIAAYIAACWERTGRIDLDKDQVCYELYVSELEGSVDKQLILERLSDYNRFDPQKNIEWGVTNIKKGMSVAIVYNHKEKKIEVV